MIRKLLADPEREGFAVRFHRYVALAAVHNAPSAGMIAHLGGFATFCQMFGLRNPFRSSLARVDLDRSLAEVRRVSAELHGGNVIVSSSEYDRCRTKDNDRIATASTLTSHYGTWAKVAAAVGLRYESRSYYMRRTCERKAAQPAGTTSANQATAPREEDGTERRAAEYDFQKLRAKDGSTYWVKEVKLLDTDADQLRYHVRYEERLVLR